MLPTSPSRPSTSTAATGQAESDFHLRRSVGGRLDGATDAQNDIAVPRSAGRRLVAIVVVVVPRQLARRRGRRGRLVRPFWTWGKGRRVWQAATGPADAAQRHRCAKLPSHRCSLHAGRRCTGDPTTAPLRSRSLAARFMPRCDGKAPLFAPHGGDARRSNRYNGVGQRDAAMT